MPVENAGGTMSPDQVAGVASQYNAGRAAGFQNQNLSALQGLDMTNPDDINKAASALTGMGQVAQLGGLQDYAINKKIYEAVQADNQSSYGQKQAALQGGSGTRASGQMPAPLSAQAAAQAQGQAAQAPAQPAQAAQAPAGGDQGQASSSDSSQLSPEQYDMAAQIHMKGAAFAQQLKTIPAGPQRQAAFQQGAQQFENQYKISQADISKEFPNLDDATLDNVSNTHMAHALGAMTKSGAYSGGTQSVPQAPDTNTFQSTSAVAQDSNAPASAAQALPAETASSNITPDTSGQPAINQPAASASTAGTGTSAPSTDDDPTNFTGMSPNEARDWLSLSHQKQLNLIRLKYPSYGAEQDKIAVATLAPEQKTAEDTAAKTVEQKFASPIAEATSSGSATGAADVAGQTLIKTNADGTSQKTQVAPDVYHFYLTHPEEAQNAGYSISSDLSPSQQKQSDQLNDATTVTIHGQHGVDTTTTMGNVARNMRSGGNGVGGTSGQPLSQTSGPAQIASETNESTAASDMLKSDPTVINSASNNQKVTDEAISYLDKNPINKSTPLSRDLTAGLATLGINPAVVQNNQTAIYQQAIGKMQQAAGKAAYGSNAAHGINIETENKIIGDLTPNDAAKMYLATRQANENQASNYEKFKADYQQNSNNPRSNGAITQAWLKSPYNKSIYSDPTFLNMRVNGPNGQPVPVVKQVVVNGTRYGSLVNPEGQRIGEPFVIGK